MKFTIKGESRYIPVSTVTLQNEGEGVSYPFHCVTCGNTSNIIGGKVTKIYPIFEPSHQIPVISTCKSCKAKYVFQDGDETPAEAIGILLHPKQETQTFYCWLGGGEYKNVNKILEYDKRRIYSYAENAYVSAPFTTHCTNTSCDIVYLFTQLS